MTKAHLERGTNKPFPPPHWSGECFTQHRNHARATSWTVARETLLRRDLSQVLKGMKENYSDVWRDPSRQWGKGPKKGLCLSEYKKAKGQHDWNS